MSCAAQPKQLIPFLQGRSLLQVALERVRGLLPDGQIFICAGQAHREAILTALPHLEPGQYLAEPVGRDTLNAVGYPAAVLAQQDPDAVVAVLTADHLIEPVDQFQAILTKGFELAELQPRTLVTFGITPTHPATAYGYLELSEPLNSVARRVQRFKEKPDLHTAERYLAAGAESYLWNSGMFVWRASTLLDCIARYAPQNHAGLLRIAAAWRQAGQRVQTLHEVYPTLPKISVDYAVMEPASQDSEVSVAAIPMPLRWLDVGSWPSFALTCPTDDDDNALSAGRHLLLDSRRNLIASNDGEHLIATIGCEDLIVVHTPHATLICRRDRAEDLKKLHEMVGQRFGSQLQ